MSLFRPTISDVLRWIKGRWPPLDGSVQTWIGCRTELLTTLQHSHVHPADSWCRHSDRKTLAGIGPNTKCLLDKYHIIIYVCFRCKIRDFMLVATVMFILSSSLHGMVSLVYRCCLIHPLGVLDVCVCNDQELAVKPWRKVNLLGQTKCDGRSNYEFLLRWLDRMYWTSPIFADESDVNADSTGPINKPMLINHFCQSASLASQRSLFEDHIFTKKSSPFLFRCRWYLIVERTGNVSFGPPLQNLSKVAVDVSSQHLFTTFISLAQSDTSSICRNNWRLQTC